MLVEISGWLLEKKRSLVFVEEESDLRDGKGVAVTGNCRTTDKGACWAAERTSWKRLVQRKLAHSLFFKSTLETKRHSVCGFVCLFFHEILTGWWFLE